MQKNVHAILLEVLARITGCFESVFFESFFRVLADFFLMSIGIFKEDNKELLEKAVDSILVARHAGNVHTFHNELFIKKGFHFTK